MHHKKNTSKNDNFLFNNTLDTKFLIASYEGNYYFAHKMFGIFLSSVPNDINELFDAIQRDDMETIANIAHKIKNNFTWVGLSNLSARMYKIETAAIAQSMAEVSLQTENLKSEFSKGLNDVELEYQRLEEFVKEEQHV